MRTCQSLACAPSGLHGECIIMIMPACQRAWIQPPPIPTLLALSPAGPGPRRQGNQWQKDAAASEGRLAAHRRGSDRPDSEPSNCPWCTEGTKQHWHLASDTDWPGPRADSAARGRWTLLVTQPTQRRPRLGSASEAAKKKPQSITAFKFRRRRASPSRSDQRRAGRAGAGHGMTRDVAAALTRQPSARRGSESSTVTPVRRRRSNLNPIRA